MRKALSWLAALVAGLAVAVLGYIAVSMTTGAVIGAAIAYEVLPVRFNNLLTGAVVFVGAVAGGVWAGVTTGKRLRKFLNQ